MNKSVNARSSYMKKPSEEDEMNIVTQLALQAAQGKSAESSVNIVRADIASSDDVQENSLRPALLGEFLGQQTVKENLSVFIDAARKRHEALDHLFLIGPPGLGKTTLAQITANELGADFKVTSAPALEKPKDLAGILCPLLP